MNVRVLLTGGTIASGFREGGAEPDGATARSLVGLLDSFFRERGVVPLFRSLWGEAGLDSSDLDPGHWVALTREVAEALEEGCGGVLILHGTDTMAYTSAWLSLCLAGVPVSVVLTGSQFTRDFTPEDGSVNLRGAAQVLCSSFPGVWLYFNWKLIPGARAHKARASHPDAFVSTNGIPVYFNPEWGLSSSFEHPKKTWNPGKDLRALLAHTPETARAVCSRMGWHFCFPGCGLCLRGDEEVLGLVGYGAGNVPQRLLRQVEETYAKRDRKPLILACSQAEGDFKNPGAYRNVGIASLSRSGFRVFSQMDSPLEFVHALGCFALLARPEAPEDVLSRHLKTFS
ncbi:Asparaginase/glutaminase [Aminomonas paucivorans DSM 12260]|uniref:Asparaginase/glutaminase n=1 Tax=Aminomonas paucivorans DSM 12260 TaxID=584708 RepID=E3D143_9BACT|nr:asparaginase domain-containing protein [Aminomonas paucivorans]EFQ23949.1 Asparaginase/glutaminase [Aminomonas paucivorans DSM 12260]